MKILLINQFYKPDVAATGQLLADLAEDLAARGHQVHVLCSRNMYTGRKIFLPSKETINSVIIHRVKATGFGRQKKVYRMLDYSSFYLLALWRAVRLPKMDVCIALTTPPFIAVIGTLLNKIKKTKLVYWTMDLYPEVAVAYGYIKPNKLLHRFFLRISKSLYKQAHCIISLGEVMTQKLITAGADPKKIQTIHNWVPGEIGGQLGRETV